MEVNPSLLFTSIISVVFIALGIRFINWVWIRPKGLEKILRREGLQGNSYRLLVGDMKDLISVSKEEQFRSISFSDSLSSHILPYYHHIREKYGQNSFMWFGPSPRLLIAEPNLMKEILMRNDIYHKPTPDPIGETLGGGLSFLEDEKWAKHRKIINPAFHIDKLKNTVPAIRLSCASMISKWESLIMESSCNKESMELDVWPYFQDLSGDVISRTAFGSSHKEGKRIFELQNELVKLALELIFLNFVPGFRYIPTKANRRMREISDETQSLLMGIINQREKVIESREATPNDLLGILMESNAKVIEENGNTKNMGMSVQEVIDECKLFYFAGSETTSGLLVWTMVMLSKHRDWQSRARDEVLHVFGSNEPTYDGLGRLKVVTMILHEVLRLYPSAPIIPRSPTKDVKLGNITLPKGADLMLLIGLLHHDPEIWGEDTNEFKPERFSEGVSGAVKEQFSYMPFSGGPRICIGQHFAMVEVKVALAMILQRFEFELSDSYLHAPFSLMSIQPQKGAHLLLRKLD